MATNPGTDLATQPQTHELAPRVEYEIALTPQIVREMAKQAELRQDLFRQLLPVALRGTRPQGWVDFGGNPWPRTAEAERLRRDFGISITSVRIEEESGTDAAGPWFTYTATGLFSSPIFGRMEVSGQAGSRDKFFAKEHDVLKPASEVDRPSIKQAAYSNMLQNGVTRILGLRDLTWEELAELSAGAVTKDRAAKVEFRSRKPDAAAGSGAPANGGDGAAGGASWVDRLEAIFNTLDLLNDKARAAFLQSITSFKRKDGTEFKGYATINGMRSAKQPERVAEIAYGKLQDLIKKGGIAVKAGAAAPTPAAAAAPAVERGEADDSDLGDPLQLNGGEAS